MFDAGRLLGGLLKSSMKSKKRYKKGKWSSGGGFGVGGGMLTMSAIGVAMAAYEHFVSEKPTTMTTAGTPPQSHSPGTHTAPLPPPPARSQTPAAVSAPAFVPPPLPDVGATGAVPPPLPPPPGFVAPPPQVAAPTDVPMPSQGDCLLLVRAMIAAANADHEIDAKERDLIMRHLDEQPLTDLEREELLIEIERPLSIGQLAEQASSPDLARSVYAASLLAIDVDTDAERVYLQKLAEKLGLDSDTVKAIHGDID